MIVGEFAGAPVVSSRVARRGDDQAAVVQRRSPGIGVGGLDRACEPSDIEITWQRLAIAQFMPAEHAGPACPNRSSLSTLPTKIGATDRRCRSAASYRGRLGAARGAGAVRAVAVQVLHRLADDEALSDDRPAGEVGMAEVEAGVEHGDLDAGAAPRAGRHPAGGQPPRRTQNLRFLLCAGQHRAACEVLGDRGRRVQEAPEVLAPTTVGRAGVPALQVPSTAGTFTLRSSGQAERYAAVPAKRGRQARRRGAIAYRDGAAEGTGFAYNCSARWNRIQLVAMNLSPPSGRLPRWVWVNAVGAISSEPVRGTILRCWNRNSVSPRAKPSLRYSVHSRCRCSVSPVARIQLAVPVRIAAAAGGVPLQVDRAGPEHAEDQRSSAASSIVATRSAASRERAGRRIGHLQHQRRHQRLRILAQVVPEPGEHALLSACSASAHSGRPVMPMSRLSLSSG